MSSPARRALVTGASSGIGEATARLLAREGYRLALLARRERQLETLVGELEGEDHLVLPCDLCEPTAIDTAFGRLERAFGGLDLLVNNAGIGYRARVEELEVEPLQRLFDTNVLALLHTCRAALPLLRQGHLPVVINISSVLGRRGIPGMAAYAASKAAVCSLGEGLRIEWAQDGIAVCTLNPALTATGFFEAQPNPSGLPDPDLADAQGPEQVAAEILALDRSPRAERSLRWKWRLLGALSQLAPRLSDRLLVRGLGGGWRSPQR